MQVNSEALAVENQLKCEKVFGSRKWVKLTQSKLFSIFYFKSVYIGFQNCYNCSAQAHSNYKFFYFAYK